MRFSRCPRRGEVHLVDVEAYTARTACARNFERDCAVTLLLRGAHGRVGAAVQLWVTLGVGDIHEHVGAVTPIGLGLGR